MPSTNYLYLNVTLETDGEYNIFGFIFHQPDKQY
jgi:hypothetical protein